MPRDELFALLVRMHVKANTACSLLQQLLSERGWSDCNFNLNLLKSSLHRNAMLVNLVPFPSHRRAPLSIPLPPCLSSFISCSSLTSGSSSSCSCSCAWAYPFSSSCPSPTPTPPHPSHPSPSLSFFYAILIFIHS